MGGTHFLQTGYLLLNRNAPFGFLTFLLNSVFSVYLTFLLLSIAFLLSLSFLLNLAFLISFCCRIILGMLQCRKRDNYFHRRALWNTRYEK